MQYFGGIGDQVEAWSFRLALDEANDVLVDHAILKVHRDRSDKLFTAKDSVDAVVVEQAVIGAR